MQDRHRYEDQPRRSDGRFGPERRRFDRDHEYDDRARRFARDDEDQHRTWDRFREDQRAPRRGGYGVWEGTPSDEREYREERRRDPWGAYAEDEDRERHGYEERSPYETQRGFGGYDPHRRFERDFVGRFGRERVGSERFGSERFGGSFGGEFGGEPESRRGSHAGKGPKNFQRADQRILEDAHEALERDPELDATEIEVACETGVIVLRGAVDSRHARRRAEESVESVAGVKDVRNELRVESGTQQSQQNRSPGSGNGERPGAGSQRSKS